MGFFFKNKKKNKEEETVTPVVETTPEVPAKEGMILVREGIKLGLPTVSMEEAIVAAGELLRDLGYVDDDYIPAMIRIHGIRTCNSTRNRRCKKRRKKKRNYCDAVSRRSRI